MWPARGCQRQLCGHAPLSKVTLMEPMHVENWKKDLREYGIGAIQYGKQAIPL